MPKGVFQSTTEIDAVTDPESGRFALGCVLAQPDPDRPNGVLLVATDGRAMAIVEEEGKLDEPRKIRASSLRQRRKERIVQVECDGAQAYFSCDQEHGGDGLVAVERDEVEGRFPRFGDVIPKVDLEEYTEISIDYALLGRLLRALQPRRTSKEGQVLFSIFVDRSRPFVDTPLIVASGGNLGILMPCTSDEQERDACQALINRLATTNPNKLPADPVTEEIRRCEQ